MTRADTESQVLATPTYYTIHHDDGKRDKRYAIRLEFCGEESPRYVLRFCGEWLGAFRSIPQATLRAVGHKNIRLGNGPIEAVTS